MPPIAPKELFVFVKESVTQSADDFLPVLLPNPEDLEGFQPPLLLN